MSEELEVLKIVCKRLGKAKIPYMITGSMAANFYAVPRMTRDIDMVLEIKKEDADRLLALFQDDFFVDRDTILEAIRHQGMFNIIHNRYVIKIDFVIRKDSLYRKLEFERKREITLQGTKIWMVSPEDLILSKLAWAKESLSEMQLGDVENLLNMVQDLDQKYMEQWVSSLGLSEVYRKVRS